MDVFVVSHTHWDREWYHGAGRFRQRLAALVDELLDQPPSERVPFLLDGQTVVLDDYVAVRPERADELHAALRERWIEAGPWYVLADELTPAGESLVRNLLAGRAMLRRLDVEPPPVLYSPDAFGHPSALPALAAGFALPVVILWRGYGGRPWPAGDTARWRAPDGATVVLHHLPPDGYEFGSSLPTTPDAAAARWRRIHGVLAPRARLSLLLVQNGADHHALQAGAQRALALLGDAAGSGHLVRRATLGEAVREIARRAADTELPMVEGELRHSYGYTWTLQGSFATRAPLKRRAANVERLLLRDVEPWVALATATDPSHVARASLAAAWRTLLRCHPHDTLCGCSVDGVARAMAVRLDAAAEQGLGLREDALAALLGHDAAAARERRAEWRPTLVARNAAARPRAGLAEVELLTFVADEPVGPGSGATHPPSPLPERWSADGGRVLVQPLAERVAHDRVESPRHYPDNDLVLRTRAVAWLPQVPSLGLRVFALGPAGDDEPESPSEPVVVGAARISNGLLDVRLDDAGRVSLVTTDGRELRDLLAFEDVGDVGDTYTPSLIGPFAPPPRFLGARVVAAGPLRGEIELRWTLRLPARRTREGVSKREARVPLRVRVGLDAGSPALRVTVRGVNRARDHRLRLLVRTAVADADVWADAAFGPVRRRPIVVPQEDAVAETPPPTAPLHRYLSLHGADGGATVYADGLAEYEAMQDGTVAVTLLRAVGALSRSDLPERPGHAGWPADTPGAQCLGPFAACLALLPHGPRDEETIALVERVADDLLVPLRATTLRSALLVPESVVGPELGGDGLALSCVKPAEDGAGLVLRCVNLLDRPTRGAWRLGPSYAEAWLARLDETPEQRLEPSAGAVAFDAGPRAIVTVIVR